MRERTWPHFDWILFVTCLLLVGYGLVLIYSAVWGTGDLSFIQRQVTFTFIGVGLMFLAAMSDYRFLESFQRPLYLLALFALTAVLLVGEASFGAQRWLGILPLQPSELTKVLVIITLAKYLSPSEEQRSNLSRLIISGILVGLPIILIYLQPSLGTAISLGIIWLVMAIMSGARLRYFGLLLVLIIFFAPFAWNYLLADYMKERILIFLNPQEDPLGAGYNINQALIAVGSGGLWGKGFLSGTQSQLHFLRVRHTDYIFSVLGEEWGFAGVVVLVLLLVILLWRILRAAELAGDAFGRLITVGVAAMIGFQAFVNIGMNLGLLPAVGIPLPFVSYGGSALLALFLALGLVQSIVMRHRKLEF
ncbi:MAG: rod shape-determining protein RodA [Chloroflexi bacterium]|nr:rod shape-determining protein RodA [Chloroflexota bacterium]